MVMAVSLGTATFYDGTQRYFGYQDTNDYAFPTLGDNPEERTQREVTPKLAAITDQPILANMFVKYGDGLNWKSWVERDKTSIILFNSVDNELKFNAAHMYAADEVGNVHISAVRSGMGFHSEEALCVTDRNLEEVDIEDAQDHLCLRCLNIKCGRE